MAEVRREGARTTAQRILDVLPSSASVVLHLDVDAFADHELPVAYFPHDDGLTLAEGRELPGRCWAISEFGSLRLPSTHPCLTLRGCRSGKSPICLQVRSDVGDEREGSNPLGSGCPCHGCRGQNSLWLHKGVALT
jgi:hypothetical protein